MCFHKAAFLKKVVLTCFPDILQDSEHKPNKHIKFDSDEDDHVPATKSKVFF